MSETRTNKWAVLIGVDHYIRGTARPGIAFHNLHGCVEDVNQVEKYLRSTLGFGEGCIRKLTATTPEEGQNEPKEPRLQWPTYENIIEALEGVTEQAEPNDFVYIHFSGHGVRAKTIFPDLKKQHSNLVLDEALVPTNIACEGGKYLRDVEIAYLLQKMTEKKLLVTVMLDCCHSGGAVRGECNTYTRTIKTEDLNTLDSDKSILHEKLASAPNRSAGGDKRGAKVGDHWLLESTGYAFLAACRLNELASEDMFGGKMQGVFSHCLLDTLNTLDVSLQELTYHELYNRVSARVRRCCNHQNVVFGGEGDRVFFGSQYLRPGLPEIETLNREFTKLGHHGSTLQRQVKLVPRPGQSKAFNELRKEWKKHGSSFAPLVADGASDPATFHVVVNDNEEYEVLDNCNNPIPGMTSPLAISDASAPEKLVRRLTHIAKFYNVRDLVRTGQPLVEIEVVGKLTKGFQGQSPRLTSGADPPTAKYLGPLEKLTSTPEVATEDWILLRVKNRETTAVNITILDLESSWAISQIYPKPNGPAFEMFEPGMVLDLPLQMTIPAAPGGKRQHKISEIIRVYATTVATSFRFLQLPDLDDQQCCAPLNSPRNALEELQASLTWYEPHERKAKVYYSQEFTTAEVEIRTTDNHVDRSTFETLLKEVV